MTNLTDSKMIDIPGMAAKALLYELSISPKPGLVDRYNNGAHTDMDFYTFIESISALAPYFSAYYDFGHEHGQTGQLTDLFHGARMIGQDAEVAMFKATRGINTHKGANFSMALFLVAIGYIKQHKQEPIWTQHDSETTFSLIQEMTKDILANDFNNLDQKTHLSYGEKLYLEHGIRGIRGEAIEGYPIIKDILMPYLRSCKYPLKESDYLKALLLLMTNIEDGNIIHRGGVESWKMIQSEAKDLFAQEKDDASLIKSLVEYDQLMIDRNLSPGGAADALALGIFLIQLENLPTVDLKKHK